MWKRAKRNAMVALPPLHDEPQLFGDLTWPEGRPKIVEPGVWYTRQTASEPHRRFRQVMLTHGGYLGVARRWLEPINPEFGLLPNSVEVVVVGGGRTPIKHKTGFANADEDKLLRELKILMQSLTRVAQRPKSRRHAADV